MSLKWDFYYDGFIDGFVATHVFLDNEYLGSEVRELDKPEEEKTLSDKALEKAANYLADKICEEVDEEVKKLLSNENISHFIATQRDFTEQELELYRKMIAKDEVIKENVF